jgi:type I restriction enzyme R subunit
LALSIHLTSLLSAPLPRTQQYFRTIHGTEHTPILLESGIGNPDDITRATEEAHGLGLFVRSLVGLDHEAAKEALATFLDDRTLGANQIEFVNLIVDHLTEHGVMDAGLLYESPFTDIVPQGPDGLFTSRQLDHLVGILEEVALRAAA